MLLYILKSAVCLAILLAFYKIFLERENMHTFKRFYLLGSLLAAFTIPFITFVEYIEIPAVTQITEQSSSYVSRVSGNGLDQYPADYLPTILWSIYAIGIAVFGFKFFKNLSQIIQRIRKNPKLRINRITNVLLRDSVIPHTFLNYIFLNKQRFEAKEIPHEVLLHEETHAKQNHSLDVLFIELVQLLFWFNPLLHFMKKAIKLNHEFLADREVVRKGIKPSKYQNILLEFSSNSFQLQLANAINYASIKKRFTVMKTETSKKSVLLRSILLFPLLGLLLLGFSSKKIIQKTQTQSSIEGLWLDKETENFGLSIIRESNQMNLYLHDTSFPVKKFSNNYHVIMENVDTPIFLDIESGLLNFCGKNYIRETHSFRKKFEGIWNDSNGEINIKIENFTDEFIWTLTKNGSTNKFYPNKNEEGFQFSYGQGTWHFRIDNGLLIDSNGKTYTRMIESISLNALEEPNRKGLTPSQLDKYNELAAKYKKNYYGESRILAEELNLMYVLQSKMSQEQKANSRVQYGFPKITDLQKRKKMPQKQIEVYNKLAEKYNKQPIEKRTIPLEDLRALEFVYRRMTTAQKAKAQPFPECLPQNTQEGASKKQIAEYNALALKYNRELSDAKNIRIKKSEVERLEYLHGLMTHEQKENAQPFPDFPEPPEPPAPPSPPDQNEVAVADRIIDSIIVHQDPYDGLIETFRIPSAKKNSFPVRNDDSAGYIKTENQITPPPAPPTPISPLVHAIEMAKKDALFYYEGKEISSDKAITLLKKNKKINLRTRHEGLKKPIVELSTKPIIIKK